MTDPQQQRVAPPAGMSGLVLRVYLAIYRWAESGWARSACGAYALAQGSVMPGPSDAVWVPLAIADPKRAVPFATWTIVGATIGSLLGYLIGYFAFDQIGLTLIQWLGFSSEQLTRARELFAQKGWLVIILGFMPMASTKLTSIAAGAFGYPLALFLPIIIAVRASRFIAVALLIRYAGERLTRWIERKLGRAITAESSA